MFVSIFFFAVFLGCGVGDKLFLLVAHCCSVFKDLVGVSEVFMFHWF